MIGNERFRNWFHRLVSVTAREKSRAGKCQLRNIPYAPAAPAAAPPGTTIDSAVDACVNSIARRNESPGRQTCHGGANVTRFRSVAPRSAAIHGHDSSLTTAQTSA